MSGTSVFVAPQAVRKNPLLLEKWNAVLGIDCTQQNFKICHIHFEKKHILTPLSGGKLRLHPNAFPCYNILNKAFQCPDEVSISSESEMDVAEVGYFRQEFMSVELLERGDQEKLEFESIGEEVSDDDDCHVIQETVSLIDYDLIKCDNLVDEVIDSISDMMEVITAVETSIGLTTKRKPDQQLVQKRASSRRSFTKSPPPKGIDFEETNFVDLTGHDEEYEDVEIEEIDSVEESTEAVVKEEIHFKKKRSYSRCKVPRCYGNSPIFVVPEAVRKSEETLTAWENALCMDCSAFSARVCQDHFEKKHILRAQRSGRLRLHPKAFPCWNLPKRDES